MILFFNDTIWKWSWIIYLSCLKYVIIFCDVICEWQANTYVSISGLWILTSRLQVFDSWRNNTKCESKSFEVMCPIANDDLMLFRCLETRGATTRCYHTCKCLRVWSACASAQIDFSLWFDSNIPRDRSQVMKDPICFLLIHLEAIQRFVAETSIATFVNVRPHATRTLLDKEWLRTCSSWILIVREIWQMCTGCSKFVQAFSAMNKLLQDAERTIWNRAIRALNCVQVGELSSARQALEGAEIAPGNTTLWNNSLTHPRDLTSCGTPFHKKSLNMSPQCHSSWEHVLAKFEVCQTWVCRWTFRNDDEHLRPLLDCPRDHRLFCTLAGHMLGRMTALSKPDGGEGIVIGDVVRRLVARTMAQQLSDAVESATVPFQHALSTRAGCECIAHALKRLEEAEQEILEAIKRTFSKRRSLQGRKDLPGWKPNSPERRQPHRRSPPMLVFLTRLPIWRPDWLLPRRSEMQHSSKRQATLHGRTTSLPCRLFWCQQNG